MCERKRNTFYTNTEDIQEKAYLKVIPKSFPTNMNRILTWQCVNLKIENENV